MKEKIIEFVKNNPYAKFGDIASFFDGRKHDLVFLLNNLVAEGDLIIEDDTYISPFSLGLIKATVVSVKHRYAFFNIADSDEDVVVEDDYLGNVLLGDTVYLRFNVMFKVAKIIKRSREYVVGEVIKENRGSYLQVNSIATDNVRFIIENYQGLNNAIVKCKIEKYLEKDIYVSVVERLGDKNAPGVDITRILLEHDCPIEFPDEVNTQVLDAPLSVSENDLIDRTDFRNDFIVTIDGEDAKDLDDAVSVSRTEFGYEVGIHIADVSNYVRKHTPLDKEAMNRGTSIYVTDRVVPMLPFMLSNGICSLNPNCDRLTLSCIVSLDENGNTIGSRIVPSVINSKARLTYTYVNEVIENNDTSTDLNKHILLLNKVAVKLRNLKNKRGSLDLNVSEIKIIVDSEGHPINLEKRVQKAGEKLIEDLMILANETVAETLTRLDYPCVYRIHENPAAKRIDNFVAFASKLGFKPPFNALNISPILVQKLLKIAETTPQATILSQVLLRSLAKARYSIHNKGHFGLASKCYAHFTSPIRRYPDLLVHRVIRDYIFNQDAKNNGNTIDELSFLAEDASIKERRAISVEREATDMKCAEYMTQFIGNEFQGFISGMNNSGMFVELTNGVSGKLKFEDMSDYYYIDEQGQHAVGRKKQRHFSLGDIVKVIIQSTDKNKGEITLQLLNEKRNSINRKENNRDYKPKRKR